MSNICFRLRELDLARGVAAFAMVAVHTLMMFGSDTVRESSYGDVLFLIGELSGIFVLVMGIAFALRPNEALPSALWRGVKVWLLGYALNLLKFVIPLSLNLLPPRWAIDMRLPAGEDPRWFFLFMGDILQFAGLTQLLMVLTRRYLPWRSAPVLIAMLIAAVAPSLWGLRSGVPGLDHLLVLLWGNDASGYFPVFPWAAFPFAGMYIGRLLRDSSNLNRTYVHAFAGGAVAFVVGFVGTIVDPSQWGDFYRMKTWGIVHYVGYTVMLVSFGRLLVERVRDNFAFRLLCYSGRKITAIYVLQWLVLYWSVGLVGYHALDATALTLAFVSVFALCSMLVWFSDRQRRFGEVRRDHGAQRVIPHETVAELASQLD